MNEHFTEKARAVLTEATALSAAHGHGYVGTVHLLYALLCTETDTPAVAAQLLISHGISPDAILAQIKRIPALPGNEKPIPLQTPIFSRILRRAEEEAVRFPTVPGGTASPTVGTEHLLFSLLCEPDSVAAHMMSAQNLPLHELYGDVLSFLSAVTAEGAILSGHDDTKKAPAAHGESAGAGDVSRYLCELYAVSHTPVIGREEETAQLITVLCRKQKNNPCLIGDAGVGKTAIVEGMAERLHSGTVPPALAGKRILSLDLAALVAGTRYRGDFEDRLRAVIAHCRADRNIILFVDEMHILMGAGAAEGALDAANLLKPALSRGELRLIGATTQTEYRRFIERDAAMARRFREIKVEEPSRADTLRMLEGSRADFAAHHGVTLPDAALQAAIDLSVRYFPDRRLPDKAFDLLDTACAEKALQATARTDAPLTAHRDRDAALLSGDLALAERITAAERIAAATAPPDLHGTTAAPPTVTVDDIAAAVTRLTHIPVTETSAARKVSLADEAALALETHIIGQRAAVTAVVSALRRLDAGLDRPGHPRASFLFRGPTGVGKTEFCRVLASVLFGDKDALLRFDMSEYTERHAVSALIGAPPGYVGYESGGALTEAVHRRPYALLLFDELEKAHPDVLHLFLQMLDAGHLTDSHGRRIDFSNTLIIMTTNAGSTQKQGHALGFAPAAAAQDDNAPIPDTLFSVFPRELLNRFDAVIPFSPLTEADIAAITAIGIAALKETMTKKGITLRLTPAAKAQLDRAAYAASKDFGARPVARILAKEIEGPLADGITAGKFRSGDTVTLRILHGKLMLSV